MFFPINTSSLVSPAHIDDIPALADIHGRSFAKGWKSSELTSLLQDRFVHTYILRRSNYRITDRIVGFVLVRAVVDESEILTIAVDPEHRKSGAGEALMLEVMRKLYADRVTKLFLEVDASNLPALSLYQKLGFEAVGERKGYYTSGKDKAATALIMQKDLSIQDKMIGLDKDNQRTATRGTRHDTD